jgi:excinuclease UvrABC nuclease subunit
LKAAVSNDRAKRISMIAAVKPPNDHGAISHFLTEEGRRVDFDIDLPSHRVLLRLRDEAHEFANALHRDTRDFANYYRLAEVFPSLTESERRKLLTAAGSVTAVVRASEEMLIEALGAERASAAFTDLGRYQAGDYVNVRPLVIPTRLQAETGAADDLRPIETVAAMPRRM